MDVVNWELRDVSCLSPWDNYQGGRAFLKQYLPPAEKSVLGGSVPVDVGFVMLKYVGFIGVTGWYS